MALKIESKTTFQPEASIEPIYTGGEVSANHTGALLASCIDEEDTLLVDLDSTKPLVRIEGDGEAVTSLCLSPDANHLVVCSRSLSMKVYALKNVDGLITAELLRSLKPHTTPVVASAIDQSSSILATGAADGVIKVWDIRGGYCSHTFHGHGGVVTALKLFMATTPMKKQSPARERKIRQNVDSRTSEGALGSELLLASGSEDGVIKIWDLNQRKSVATLESHTSVVRSLDYSPEAGLLLSAGRDRTIVLWNSSSWKLLTVITALEELEAAGFIMAGQFCYAGGENGTTRIWSTVSGKELTAESPSGLETDAIVAIIPQFEQNTILTIRNDQTMTLQSTQPLKTIGSAGKPLRLPVVRRISGNHDEIIDMACVGIKKSMLAIGDNTESVKIISVDMGIDSNSKGPFGSDIAKLDGHEDVVICMDVDWSGHWLVTGAKDNTARLWKIDPDSSSYDCIASFAGHTGSLGAVALPRTTPTENSLGKSSLNVLPQYLITGSEDKTIKKWDLSKISVSANTEGPNRIAKSVFTRVAHEKDINAIDTSPIAPLFASASQDKTIKIWSTEDGSVVGILRGHKRGVWSIRFSPAHAQPLNLAEGGTSGSRGLLVSGSGDTTVKIWSLSTYTCLLTFEGHQNSVLKVLWLPPTPEANTEDRTPHAKQHLPMIASASSDTLIKIWSPYASADSDHLLTTLDGHNDRVWSLATPLSTSIISRSDSKPQQLPYTLISGAADAKLTFWRDTTTQTASETSKAHIERIEQDQLLQNHILARNYREVITLALALNHPGRLLKVFEDVVSLPDTERDSESIMGVQAVDDVLSSLSQEEVFKLLERVRDWNTNARTAVVAQKVLNCLLKKYPHDMWLEMARNRDILRLARSGRSAGGQGNGVRDLFRALEVYTDRHYKRLDELVDESYLIEYTLREMDELAGGIGDSINGNHISNDGQDGDIIML